MKLGELNVSGLSPAGPQAGMTLTNLRIHVDAKQNGTLINAYEEIAFDQFQVGTEQFNNGVIQIELNRLDATTISALQQKIQPHANSQPPNTDPDVIQGMVLSELQAHYPP